MVLGSRVIVSDNRSASVLAYKLLLKDSGHLDDHLFIEHDYQKICLLHDAIDLTKNVRNNSLNYKIFIFPAFEYDRIEDPVSFKVIKFLENHYKMFWKKTDCSRLT